MFTWYILKHKVGSREDDHTLGGPERNIQPINEESHSQSSQVLMRNDSQYYPKNLAAKMISILNKMDAKKIHMLYYKIAIETRERLADKGMLPDICPPETKSHKSDPYHQERH